MASLQQTPDFITWAFGADFKARLDADREAKANAKPKANPRDSWPAWTDADTWEDGSGRVHDPRPEVEPEDTRDHAVAFAPSRRDELYRLGYELGLDREDAASDAVDAEDLAAFHGGYLAGKAEWDRRLEVMCGSAEYSDFSGRIDERDIYRHGGVS